MAAWMLRRFCNPAMLRLIPAATLAEFLKPFNRYLLSRGVPFNDSLEIDPQHHSLLIGVLLQPDSKTPPELVTALHVVDEMATEEGMNALFESKDQQSLVIRFGENPTALDVAIRFWIEEPRLLEMRHAERTFEKTRTYETFQSTSRTRRKHIASTSSRIAILEQRLDEWFVAHERGSGSTVIPVPSSEHDWFLIRHGGVFQREERHAGRQAETICFRPAKYDIVHFLRASQELRINARSKRESELYQSAFGELLFDNPQQFSGTAKYTLDPLRDLQEDALAPGPTEGIESITLREVHLLYGGEPSEIVIRKSGNLFANWSKCNRHFPESGRILSAKFRIVFSDSQTARMVTIRPPNHIQCTRDSDAIIVEEWLRLRGFILNSAVGDLHEVADAALVRT